MRDPAIINSPWIVVAFAILAVPFGCGKGTVGQGGYGQAIKTHSDGLLQAIGGQPTIRRVRLILDEQPLTGAWGDQRFDPPQATAAIVVYKYPASSGHHSLRIEVTDQMASPTTYHVGSMTLDLEAVTGFYTGGVVSTITLPERTQALLSGEAIVFDFDL